MFYLLRTKYRRKFDLLMALSQSEILSLCYYFPYYSDHLLDHIKIHVFFMLIIVSFFWQTHYPFGEFSIQSKLNPNMIHDACHANSSLNWIKAYDCQQIYVTNVGGGYVNTLGVLNDCQFSYIYLVSTHLSNILPFSNMNVSCPSLAPFQSF